MKTTNPYLAPALRSLLSDTRRTFTPIEAIVLHEAADALEAASAKPTPAAQPAACEHDERAWLIERPGPLYWTGIEGCAEWGAHDAAMRFSRECDADRMRRSMGMVSAKATEHVWPRVIHATLERTEVRPVPEIEDDELGADSETEARHRAALPEGSAPSPAPAREWTGMQRSGARVVALNVPAKDPLDMTDADLDRICVALANVLPRFVRMKMPNIWPSDFAAEDQDGGKDYDEGFADGQESMRNRCIAALRAQGIEVIEDRKPTEQYRFSVDGKTYTHPSARISVPQILMYAHLTGDSSATPPIGPHTLCRVIDAFPDQQLRPDERVDLTLGQVTKFISVPPGIMGG